jgi:hypothetical protein
MKINHVPGYVKNEKNNPPEDNTPIDPVINNNITTTTQATNNNTVNNAYTVNIRYGDLYKAKYHHRHPRSHHESKIDYDKLFKSTLSDIVNLKFNCYRRDFLINFLNSMF